MRAKRPKALLDADKKSRKSPRKKKPVYPPRVNGKECPDCGQKYQHPTGGDPYECLISRYDDVLHSDVRDCVRYQRERLSELNDKLDKLDKLDNHDHDVRFC